ncbi:MAG TPA: glycolate oxidase subunit GlcF [Rhizomicrobium sp.]|jgi:glycolate oxidase iron-sulfur subunit|nr:glycolate oxidase subunit GlcF [Rhizomicrobium sp.]
MRTHFTPTQLTDPHIAEAEKNLRACVHCGICTATCPTYVLLGDERDGPRGRIVMMQNMLEKGGAPDAETVLHVDRCLSCLACRTACPSSVDYARLVDEARAHIQTHYRRPLGDKFLRWLIATVMPRPALVRAGVFLARLFAPLAAVLPGRLGVMARIGAAAPAQRGEGPLRAILPNARRIALLPGCVQAALAPDIDGAVARLLARRGIELVPLEGAGCCGALVHHLGRSEDAKNWARRAVDAFERAGGPEAFDGVLITATGCSSHLKDLTHLFLDDPLWLPRARALAGAARDLLDLIAPGPAAPPRHLRVAWHAACSLQNGLKLGGKAEALLAAAGFDVAAIPEGHLCCGSAGSYAILQPEIAGSLRARKLGNIAGLGADIVASSNIGCLSHLAGPDAPPLVHLAELLDWAEGGPVPVALARHAG